MEIKTRWDDKKGVIAIEKGEGEKIIEKVGFYSKVVFWVLIAALLIGGGFTSYFLFQYQKSRELNFDVFAPSKALIAKPFEISINLENKSESVLRDPKILVQLPEGAVSPDGEPGMKVIEQKIEDMNPGDLVKKSFRIIFTKDDQATEKINANFSYVPENLTTRFEKNQAVEIFVDQPAISMGLVNPQKVFNREIFEIGVNYQNISDFKFDKARLQLAYPNNFTFKESSVVPTSGKNIWDLGELVPGAQNNIVIKGSVQGADQSSSEIKSQLFVSINGQEYLINEKSASLGIASSPLSLSVSANNSAGYFAVANDLINYQIRYKNNTDVGLSDVILKVKLSGEMFDFASLKSSGFFDSINKIIVWNTANTQQFKTLNPGEEGTISFSIRTRPDYPIKRMFDKNFILKVAAEINSPTVPYNISSDKTVGLANLETKVSGKAEISASSVYVSGPAPVKADQPTVYEIHWQIKNFSTDIKNIAVGSFLQSGVKWLDKSKSDIEAVPVYNDRTGEIIWAIDKILATKGVIGKPLEAVFEVEATPNITQIGQAFPFLSETSISATDDFTGMQIGAKTDFLKTPESVAP